jgi:hypothetical protein
MENIEILPLLVRTAISSVVSGSLMFLILRWHLQQMRQRAGDLLLPLPMTRSRRLVLLAMLLVILSFAFLIQHLIFPTSFESAFSSTVSGLVIGTVVVVIIGNSIELRERGILVSFVLLRWSQIQSYRWSGSNQRVLWLDLNRPLDLDYRRKLKFWIDPSRQSDVERIFHQKLDRFGTN